MKSLYIIRHVDYERLGWIPELLKELGIPFESISLAEGDELPVLSDVLGIITMGGPMSAYEREEYPWIDDEMPFVRKVINNGIPFLGICLGGQIAAQAFGAEVKKGTRELGWLSLEKTEEGKQDSIFADFDIPLLFQFHGDQFDLPEGAVNLLKSDSTENQCIRLADKAYGIQFHPETNEEMITSVVEEYRDRTTEEELKMVKEDPAERSQKGREFLKAFLERIFK